MKPIAINVNPPRSTNIPSREWSTARTVTPDVRSKVGKLNLKTLLT